MITTLHDFHTTGRIAMKPLLFLLTIFALFFVAALHEMRLGL